MGFSFFFTRCCSNRKISCSMLDLKSISSEIQASVRGVFQSQVLSLFRGKQTSAAASEPSYRLACDLGKAKMALVEIMKSQDAVTLTKFHKMPRPKEKKDIVEALWKSMTVSGFKTNKVRIAVKGQGVILRFIQFPKMSPEEIKSALAFEAEKYIPFKAEEVVVDYHILDENVASSSGPVMSVLLVAVKKEEIYPLLSFYQEAGLEVEFVDVDVLAFFNTLEYFYPEEFKSSVGILDIGSEISTLGIVKAGKPQFIRDISYGGIDLVKRLKRKLGFSTEQAMEQLEVDRQPAPQVQQEIIEGLAPLVADLKISLDYYLEQVQIADSSLQKLFLSGGAGYHPIVAETLSKDLGVQILSIDIAQKIQIDPQVDMELVKQNQALLPIALGLCLR